jgi:hypothetical protein
MSMSTTSRSSLVLAGASVLLAAALAGCAAMKSLTSEVSTYGEWPAGRAAGTYVIERLPSQQNPTPQQQEVEQGAHQALQSAGFTPAAEGATPDVVVQIGARVTRYDRSPWDDPWWWHPYGGRWIGPGWGPYAWSPRWAGSWRWRTESDYQREVGMLIRDRASGQALYEARARSDGLTAGSPSLISAMFAAALKDFPKANNQPHDVAVQLP